MKVLICGSWESHKASNFAQESTELGKSLAEAGFDVILGSGTGVAKHVLEGFNSIRVRGRSIFYLPDLKEMKRVGEVMTEEADLVIQTGGDYPSRNLTQIKMADALAVIGGADATVAEIINAVLDYKKPVAVLDKTGPVSAIVRMLPKTGNKIYLAKSVKSMIEFLKLMNTSPHKSTTVPVHSA
jgi:predicted Rossmann-fold nucleotide-binding protein